MGGSQMFLVQRFGPRPLLGGALGLALTVGLVGCSSPASTTESSTPTASAETTEAPTESPSAAATAAESAPASIAADADLAALLPTTLSGEAVTAHSFVGDQALSIPLGLGTSDFGGGIEGIAENLGVPLSDIQGAAVFAQDHEQFSPHAVAAIRFSGADPSEITEVLAFAIDPLAFSAGQVELTEETVGDKPVSVLSGSVSENAHYFYVVGDVVFIVQTTDPGEAEEVLQELP